MFWGQLFWGGSQLYTHTHITSLLQKTTNNSLIWLGSCTSHHPASSHLPPTWFMEGELAMFIHCWGFALQRERFVFLLGYCGCTHPISTLAPLCLGLALSPSLFLVERQFLLDYRVGTFGLAHRQTDILYIHVLPLSLYLCVCVHLYLSLFWLVNICYVRHNCRGLGQLAWHTELARQTCYLYVHVWQSVGPMFWIVWMVIWPLLQTLCT